MSREEVKRSAKRWWARALLVPVVAISAVAFTTSTAATAPGAPIGLTALAQDSSVVLAWKPVSGATGYRVYRGTSAGATNTLVSGTLTSAGFTDTTAANAAAVFYSVKAVDGSGESPASKVAGATPRARTCSSSNAIVLENCFPGTTAWKTTGALQASNGGIEGFATATSVNAGGSVDLKVRTTNDNVPFHVEIYRSGSYGGTQGRLVSTLVGLTANSQPACQYNSSTGLRDCSTWSSAATITTSSDWPSGVYLLRIVRDDNGTDNHVLVVVRRDGDDSAILYGVPVSTYQAYNNYGGKSMYDWNSSGGTTVAGTQRAVEVSYDRPYQQTVLGMTDWYTTVDVRNVSWLERQGYDVSYSTSVDLASAGALSGHRVFLSPSHDEYWSSGMRNAITSARNAGTSLAFLGSNAVYWKIRYAASPVNGIASRVQVGYKTIQGGPADPSGDPTTTWRDPSGPNQPENGLLGQMYIGDSDGATFRMRVNEAQGIDTVWRNTSVATIAPGSSETIGNTLVGWEWDARVANGAEPAGVVNLSASAVNGNLVQGNGASYTTGSATANSTRYQAANGALVFASGTNNWSKALGVNMGGVGEANSDIAQATMNILTDMGVAPATPAAGLVAENVGTLAVTARTPAPGATGVAATSAVTATLGLTLAPSTVTSSTVTLTGPSGAVAAAVAYDVGAKRITLTPSAPLAASATYTVTLAGSIATPWGASLGSPVTWNFSTGGTAAVLSVTARTPAPGTTGVSQTPSITATFNLSLDPATVTTSSVTLDAPGGPVAASVSYDNPTKRITLTPSANLPWSTTYTVTLSTAISATDGTALAAPVTWQFATAAAPNGPAAPVGLTALAQDGSVGLAWKSVSGATGYRVYRGPSAGSTNTLVSGTLTGTDFTDTTAVNGTGVFYAVKTVEGGVESPASEVAGATPRARTCSSPNAIVLENCFPGTTAWKTTNAVAAGNGGIEGFATAASVNAGGSVDLKVRTTASAVPFHVEIYRSGSYGGTQGRLVSTLVGLTADAQPACQFTGSTGLRDCSTWSSAATITTSSDWPTGVYLLRIVRDDNGTDNHVLLIVRSDSSNSAILYGVPVSTYQAYNNYGGKSMYDWNSSGDPTVAGTQRAVEVSFDRPYQQSVLGIADWYTTSDVRNVSWLERQGYDVSYSTSVDLASAGALSGHRVFLSPSHDEYWSSGMRNAVTAARNSGTSLAFLGANAVYWKIRYAASPVSGIANRVAVGYKSIQSGPADPSGDPTTTWRDPSGPNQPENALLGQMYIGDSSATFRMGVTEAQGKDTIWRNATVANIAPGGSATLGNTLVGWEWDARVANGAEPPGVVNLSASAVTGNLVQGNGASYTTGSATANSTRYQAASGALVFASGTNNWSKALGVNMAGVGEANSDIAQATMNLLTDMGVAPATPAAGLVAENVGTLAVTARTPAPGATGVAAAGDITATLGLTLAPSTVNASSVTLTGPSGTVAAAVSYNVGAKRITLDPSASLATSTTYTVTLAGSIASPWGVTLGAPVTWTFTTEAATALSVTARTPAPGATGVGLTPQVTATFNLNLDPATVTTSSVTLSSPGGPVAGSVSYDNAAKRITLTPSASLAGSTTYTVTLSTAISATDGTALAAPVTWSFTTAAPCPCSLLSGTPASLHLPVRDGRGGTGPWSYEMGMKVQATAAAQLTHIRYWRDSSETGTHTGRVWSSTGTLLASVAFTGETASGWQTQALPSPLALQAGTTYVVSVGFNAFFAMTRSGLLTQITNGPIRTDVTGGTNGVYGSAAGVFPTSSWSQSNYFVDLVVQ